jgi:hypothetical protein
VQPGDDTEDEEDDEEFTVGEPQFLAPGAQAPTTTAKGKKSSTPAAVSGMDALLAQAVANNELKVKDLIMLQMLQQLKGRPKKNSGEELLDDNSSADEDETFGKKGLKAVHNLEKLHSSQDARPDQVILAFEGSIRSELGVIEGQPWSLTDWNRKLRWGHQFKTLNRCMELDIAVYQKLRSKNYKGALLQLVRSMKTKHQVLLQQGDWSTAWLLSNLKDPLKPREFAGSPAEMSVVSGYLSGLADLKKKVGTAPTGQVVLPEEEEGEPSKDQKKKGGKK